MSRNLTYFILISYLIALNVSRAQITDSLITAPQITQLEYKQTKSPTGAMFRSMVVPGWGQFYNESYWKIPLVWGALGAFAYAWKWNNDKVNYYDDKYHSEHNTAYYEIREFYRNQRDLNTVFFILVYVLNVVDAYVDAHMFDFEITNNSAFRQKELKVHFTYRF